MIILLVLVVVSTHGNCHHSRNKQERFLLLLRLLLLLLLLPLLLLLLLLLLLRLLLLLLLLLLLVSRRIKLCSRKHSGSIPEKLGAKHSEFVFQLISVQKSPWKAFQKLPPGLVQLTSCLRNEAYGSGSILQILHEVYDLQEDMTQLCKPSATSRASVEK